jgi:hypothetical protein
MEQPDTWSSISCSSTIFSVHNFTDPSFELRYRKTCYTRAFKRGTGSLSVVAAAVCFFHSVIFILWGKKKISLETVNPALPTLEDPSGSTQLRIIIFWFFYGFIANIIAYVTSMSHLSPVSDPAFQKTKKHVWLIAILAHWLPTIGMFYSSQVVAATMAWEKGPNIPFISSNQLIYFSMVLGIYIT